MFKSRETADAIIVGGGVIGLTIARALRKRGVRDVMLIERGQMHTEASWAAGGLLAPQIEADRTDDFFRLACASRDLYPDFARAMNEESGTDVELDTTGTLYLAFTSQAESEFRHRYDWQANAGFAIEWLNADKARALEPGISDAVRCALRFPNDIQVENRKLVRALTIANERLGVRLVSGRKVSELCVAQEQVCGVDTSIGRVSAPVVVLAAGAWTSLIESTLPEIEIEPVRGQMLCFEARPPLAHHVIYSSRGYLIPRRDGRILVGSTNERVGFDKNVTTEGMDKIRSMAVEIAPAVAHLPLIDSWSGLRPRAADDLPVLGSWAGIEGLFYATGHYRNGILLAPITGELIAKSIVEGVTSPMLAAFSPGRFRNLATSQ